MTPANPIDDDRHPSLVTVAAVNFSPVPDDTAGTLAKVVDRVRDAARQGADLIVFPESTIGSSGPCEACEAAGSPCGPHLAAGLTVPGPETDRLVDLAAEVGTHIVLGIDERVEDGVERPLLHNSAVLIGPDGLIGTYRKLHLGRPTESSRFTPGDRIPVFDTAIGPIGILICYDFWSNPELSRILALKGARILVNPTRSVDQPGKADYVRNTTVVRAQENLVYAVSANIAGPIGEGRSAGHSTIAGPAFPAFNHVYGEAGTDEETIVATLNFTQLDRWYDLFAWRSWRLDPDAQLPVTELIADELTAIAAAARSGEGLGG